MAHLYTSTEIAQILPSLLGSERIEKFLVDESVLDTVENCVIRSRAKYILPPLSREVFIPFITTFFNKVNPGDEDQLLLVGSPTILIPYNVGGNHWVTLHIEISYEEEILFNYIDSLKPEDDAAFKAKEQDIKRSLNEILTQLKRQNPFRLVCGKVQKTTLRNNDHHL